jgi:hypothetical protein
METISELISRIINIGIWLLILMIPIIIILSFACMIVTGFTYLYSIVTKDDYDFICDQSQILYTINRIGKVSATISGLFILGILSLILIF